MNVVTVNELPVEIIERIKNLPVGETITFVSAEGIPEGFYVSVHGLHSQTPKTQSESVSDRVRSKSRDLLKDDWFDELEALVNELESIWVNNISAVDMIADVRG